MPEAIVALVVVVGLLLLGRSWLKSRTEARLNETEAPEGDVLGAAPVASRAPVTEFHVVGDEARVIFDVPLGDEEDEVLNEILLDEAYDVLRQKRHVLPIADVHELVVFAGRGTPREVARSKLPSPGVLPPPPPESLLNLGNVTRDPFTTENQIQDAVAYETKANIPSDDLPPIGKELKIPKGLERGLRAAGIDIANAGGPEIVLGIMRLFGYSIDTSAGGGTYNAIKGGETTMVFVDDYKPGDHPEVDEGLIRAFGGRFSMSGAQRAVFVSEKYAPYMIYEIERKEPRLRFITRERLQEFIDSMAIG